MQDSEKGSAKRHLYDCYVGKRQVFSSEIVSKNRKSNNILLKPGEIMGGANQENQSELLEYYRLAYEKEK